MSSTFLASRWPRFTSFYICRSPRAIKQYRLNVWATRDDRVADPTLYLYLITVSKYFYNYLIVSKTIECILSDFLKVIHKTLFGLKATMNLTLRADRYRRFLQISAVLNFFLYIFLIFFSFFVLNTH